MGRLAAGQDRGGQRAAAAPAAAPARDMHTSDQSRVAGKAASDARAAAQASAGQVGAPEDLAQPLLTLRAFHQPAFSRLYLGLSQAL